MKAIWRDREPRERAEEGQGPRQRIVELLAGKQARIGIIGLGYVGLPLAVGLAHRGFQTVGFEIDARKAEALNAGRSYVGDVSGEEIAEALSAQRFCATTDFARLTQCDCIVVCVPTPLGTTNDPDLSFIESATAEITRRLRRGQLVVLESTTYPGCTEELVLPELLRTGLRLDRDFLLAFSPERVDPGNTAFKTTNIPRIVGGCSPDSAAAAKALYEQVVPSVQVVSSPTVAETAKLLENTFRAINIALVNETAIMCRQMGIDIWEVIEAARTKPYGFMPFYPGPGIGGHCIPLDPAYLSWRGRQFGFDSRFIALAQQINGAMPGYVVQLVADALNDEGKALKDSSVLILGVAYKRDVNDVRESPAIEIIQSLRWKKAGVSYHDPFVASIDFAALHPRLRRPVAYTGGERRGRVVELRGGTDDRARRAEDVLRSAELTDEAISSADCVVIVTDHSCVDYERVARLARVVVDTRNALRRGEGVSGRARVVGL